MNKRERERDGMESEGGSLCALEAAKSQCVSSGVQSRDDQRFWARHIHQGSPQGRGSGTACRRIKCAGLKRNEIIYSGTGVEGICMCERGMAEERIKAAFGVCER